MEHAEYLVDLVDENGVILGSKKRHEIDKQSNLYHTVFVLLSTPHKRLILSKIRRRDDLPNLYVGQMGPTVSTIKRHNEGPGEASRRALKNELYLEDVELAHLGDTFVELPDGHKKYMSVYYGVHSIPRNFSHKDIEVLDTFNRNELVQAMKTSNKLFAPTFMAIWQRYQDDLL